MTPYAALSAMILLLIAGCGSGHSASRAGVAAPGPHGDPEAIIEDERLLHSNPAGTLDAFRRLGVDRVRVYVNWQSLAPDPTSRVAPAGFAAGDPAAYASASWGVLDTIVREAAARGIGLDFTVGGPAPRWAAGVGAPRGAPYPAAWKPSASQYGAFVRALATRFDGHYTPAGGTSPLPRVSFWAIWNEPNYGPDLAPQAIDHSTVEISPSLYRGLLDAAWSALQVTGHGRDTIVIGETAPRGLTTGDQPGNFSGMVPLRFIRALYCVDASFRALHGAAATLRRCPADAAGSHQFPLAHPALFHASGYADHPYPSGGVPPNTSNPLEPDYADLPSLPKLEHTLDRAQGVYGSSARLPIYATEFGYQTNPPETVARTTSPSIAAIYLNWSEYLSWRDPRVRSYDQYQLADPPGANALGGFATGLQFKNQVPKATYEAYRLPVYLPLTASHHGQAVEVWGCVRPAGFVRHQTRRRQRVRIQFQPGSHGAFETLESVTITDRYGYFDTRAVLPASGSVRLQWTYPDGTAIHSRLVAVTVG